MKTIGRREFIGAAVGATLLGKGRTLGNSLLPTYSSQATDSRIEVLTAEPVGRIAPEIYGHFVEHLGGVVYDGVWVGEDSKIPNIGGVRKELVEAMKRVKPGVIRWPGGCFADSYNWRDGIGPRSQRPRRTNFWAGSMSAIPDGPWKYDPNHFGSNEFYRFCRLSGAEPYFAANLRSLTANDFYEWIEYCNSPAGSTTLADMRAAAGDREPFKVRYWGVGNESWGCGGNFAPEEYAVEFRRFAEWVPGFGLQLAFIGSGPNGGDLEWTRRFLAKLAERNALGRLWGWGLHHYSWNVSGGRTNDWNRGKGDGLKYETEEWYELLREGDRVESLITSHWTVMGEIDRQHRVKLAVDEWGAWYKQGSEVDITHLLGQQSTMRDAVLAGLSLDTFNRHADKVAMANVAQLINCLQSLFLAHEDKFVLTPTFHVFEMYAAHQGAQSIRTVFSAPRCYYTRNGQPASIYGLSGSASLRDKTLTLTVTNPHISDPREAEIAVRGAVVKSARATTLAAGDVHTHNSFENPRSVEPKDEPVRLSSGMLIHRFAPASVTRLEISLA